MRHLPSIPHAELTDQLIGAHYTVYNELGYGFLESVYERAMGIVLAASGLAIQRQPSIDVIYRGETVGTFRADLIIEGIVVLELEVVAQLLVEHEAQLLNYLRASGASVGLLMNFGPKPTFRRVVHRGGCLVRDSL